MATQKELYVPKCMYVWQAAVKGVGEGLKRNVSTPWFQPSLTSAMSKGMVGNIAQRSTIVCMIPF